VRRDAEADPAVGTRLTGVTGQRQTISFAVDEHGRGRFLATRIWTQCPGWPEHAVNWTPMSAVPAIRWAYDPLRVSQKWWAGRRRAGPRRRLDLDMRRPIRFSSYRLSKW
jgi:hypothetical protein